MSVPSVGIAFIISENKIKSFDASIWNKESLINYVNNTLKNIESLKYEFSESEDSILWNINYGTQMFNDFVWLKKSDTLIKYYNTINTAAAIARSRINSEEEREQEEQEEINNIILTSSNSKKRLWANIHINLYFDENKNEYIVYFNKYSGSTISFK